MPAEASITITVYGTGAVTAINNVTNEVTKMGPAFQRAGSQGNVVLTQLTKQQLQARDAGALLSRMLGVEMPRQLNKFLASSQTIGPILAGAFNVAIIAAAAAAIVNVASKIPSLIEKLTAWQLRTVDLNARTAESNKLLSEQARHVEELRNQYALIGLEGAARFAKTEEQLRAVLTRAQADVVTKQLIVESLKQLAKETELIPIPESIDLTPVPTQRAEDAAKALAKAKDEVDKAKDVVSTLWIELAKVGKEGDVAFGKQRQNEIEESNRKIEQTARAAEQAGLKLAGMADAARTQGLSPLETIAEHERQAMAEVDAILKEYPKLTAEAENARTQIVAAATRERVKLYEQEAERAIAAEQRRVAEMEKNFEWLADLNGASIDTRLDAEGEALREQQRMQEEYLRDVQNAQREMAQGFERLFWDITRGGIGRAFLRQFTSLVSQMLASWIVGAAAMKNSTQGALGAGATRSSGQGGILGVLGSILGAPRSSGQGPSGSLGTGGAVPGSTPPFFPGPSFLQGSGPGLFGGAALGEPAAAGGVTAAQAAALGIPIAGVGASLPGTIATPGNAGAAAGAAGVGGLLAKLFPHGLKIGGVTIQGAQLAVLGATLGISGFTSLLSGRGNTAVGALSTIGGAALTGFSIGGLPGAVVGGIIGAIGSFFGWLFGRNKINRQRDQLAEQLQQQLKILEQAYDVHQLDYGSAISQAEQLRAQFMQAQDQVKKGADMQRYVGFYVDRTEKHINEIEGVRGQRQQVMDRLPLPEFATGGFVDAYSPGGAVLARLHDEEAVLNPAARRRLGDQNIAALNRGEGAAPAANQYIEIHPGAITVNAAPDMDAAQLAGQVMRRLQQTLGDRGLRLGST